MSNVDLPLTGLRADGLHRTIASRTKRVYDSLAAVYPLSTLCFHSRAHRAALADSGVRDGMRVLEVATGSGEMFRRLVKANPNGMTVGVDLSPNMAARSQKRVRRKYPRSVTSCQVVDARRLPYPDDSFDALVSCYLLELLSTEDIVGTVGEFYRVLRPGSTLTLILIGQDGPIFNQLYEVATRVVPAFWGPGVESRVPALIEARGFEIQSDRRVRQSGYPSRVLVARR